MIEEDETLNSVPWGRLFFNLTIEFFKRVAQSKGANCTFARIPTTLISLGT